MQMIELKPCPVCGRKPKIKRNFAYEVSGFGAWCIIQCKPFIGKAHLKVVQGKSTWDRALLCSVDEWNWMIDNGKDL